jgi:hypothetical protein
MISRVKANRQAKPVEKTKTWFPFLLPVLVAKKLICPGSGRLAGVPDFAL